MRQSVIDVNELSVNLERLAIAELMDWAQAMDYFGDQPFVWDGHHGLDSQSTMIMLNSNQHTDELLPDISKHAGPALPGGRRRHRGGAQDCHSA
jgi:hypothetical protein